MLELDIEILFLSGITSVRGIVIKGKKVGFELAFKKRSLLLVEGLQCFVYDFI